ncbi:MAG: hypothetical protein A2846_00150 [Candidatus Doudnabacteria bacterium RIFCSPHIGHO2_01_FULL_49_9]|uniref:Uncharacterized protein n=1 Tax=Candidatus Doudnabacteria bacterium RIFCSPHIGHO2_01_FULL_49_9 TaxID=1817827 RepID=A0A1F5P2V5_9BACT|nr:MAG: hypothetical protein A2846_00150 [Candidatus Doudnabacteria bacterium RIFCSPHIGHO2_01_FULL_49_9]
MEQIFPVRWTVEPRLDHTFGGEEIKSQIFPKNLIRAVPGRVYPRPDVMAVRVDMGEIITVNHILGFSRGGLLQGRISSQRIKIAGLPLLVDQYHEDL